MGLNILYKTFSFTVAFSEVLPQRETWLKQHTLPLCSNNYELRKNVSYFLLLLLITVDINRKYHFKNFKSHKDIFRLY